MNKRKQTVFYVSLNISSADFKHYYAQNINQVIVSSHSGQRIQFPANVLLPYVTHTGVQGNFKIVIDEDTKLKSIDRVKDSQ